MNITYRNEATGDNATRKESNLATVFLDLPIGPPAPAAKAASSMKLTGPTDLGDRSRVLFDITDVAAADFSTHGVSEVELRDQHGGRELKVLSYAVTGKNSLRVIVKAPSKPKTASCDQFVARLVPVIRTNFKEFRGEESDQRTIYWAPKASEITLDPNIGSPGIQATIKIPDTETNDANDIESVRFGTLLIAKSDLVIAKDKLSATFIIPAHPHLGIVDVIINWKVGKPKRIGSFRFTKSATCCSEK